MDILLTLCATPVLMCEIAENKPGRVGNQFIIAHQPILKAQRWWAIKTRCLPYVTASPDRNLDLLKLW
jgi:hypothetical protein